jgi:uncharacterized membrane protein
MANTDIIMPLESGTELPVVREIGFSDLKLALEKGFDDFRAMPTHAIFLCLIYPVVGLLLGSIMLGLELIPLLYPIVSGFALIGPFAAIGLYELSRRREQGLDTSWQHAFDVLRSPSLGAILVVGLLLLILLGAWVGIAHLLYTATFGIEQPTSVAAFLGSVLGTREGTRLIVLGNLIGLAFALVAFLVSALSFPLLLDRHVSPAVAIATSFRAVLVNPRVMTAWALIVAAALAIGSLPALLGLAVVVPVLGHATWHLYRLVVAPADGERPEYQPMVKGVRYAADFPASLFTRSRPPRQGPDETA